MTSEQVPDSITFQYGSYELGLHLPEDSETGTGYFEHNSLGENSAGKLWFVKIPLNIGEALPTVWELSDYDGVNSLPEEVVDGLKSMCIFLDQHPEYI